MQNIVKMTLSSHSPEKVQCHSRHILLELNCREREGEEALNSFSLRSALYCLSDQSEREASTVRQLSSSSGAAEEFRKKAQLEIIPPM